MGMMINRRRVYGGDGNQFIQFADPAVKAICVALWGGADGGTAPLNTRVNNTKVLGVAGEMTYEQAASVTTLPQRTFYNNNSIVLLDDLKYFVNLSSIAGEAVSVLRNLLSITLPPSVISCVAYAFYSLKEQRDVHITNLESFCKSNFSRDLSTPVSTQGHIYLDGVELTQVTIPNGVTSINGTFYNAAFITQVILHNGITSIGNNTFRASGITSIDIPDSVTRIGAYAFNSCTRLVSLTLGSGLTSFSGNHWYMRSLESITSKAMVAPTLGDAPFLGVKQGGILYVPKGSTGYDTLWMSGSYSLGSYNWTMVEIDM